jgi:phosphatidate cytidylyltransferase
VKQRSISAIGVALVGILPALFGGPIWAVAFAALCTIGFFEYLGLARGISPNVRPYGLLFIPLFAAVPWFDCPELALLGFASLAVMLPGIEATLRSDLTGAFADWALAAAGALYLGLPLYAAVELRRRPGTLDAEWLDDIAGSLALDWSAFPRGLAWVLSVILITWMADTFAYLVGKRIGRRKLSPVVSPNKTVEGLIGGTIAAAITGAIALAVFGIHGGVWIGLLIGAALALIGLFGDLMESVLKREAGVKDSSALIPGHGGMLDRLDALLFTFVAGLYLALLADHFLV